MRLTQILPYAALILLAGAAVATVPGVVAAREGGMGPGSALVIGQLAQVAGVAVGAAAGAYVVDRWSTAVALIAGAIVSYGGLIGVGHQPAHLLGWVIVALAVAGVGLGLLLTASFMAATHVSTADRPVAVALLLLASLVAPDLASGARPIAGVRTLVVVATAVVAGALLARPPEGRRRNAGATATPRAGLVIAGAGLLGVGALAALSGIDPSRVSAVLLGGSIGLVSLGALDALRVGLVLGGLLGVVAGAGLVLRAWRPSRRTVLAAGGVAAAALSAAGVLALVGFAMSAVASPAGTRGGLGGEVVAVAGGVLGLAAGGWLLRRGASPRVLAVSGGLLLTAVSLVAVFGGGSLLRSSGGTIALGAMGIGALGAGLTAAALRLLLADAPAAERAVAAAAGVAAATVGAMAGLMIGSGEGMTLAFESSNGPPIGVATLVIACLLTVSLAALLREPAGGDG